MPTYKTSADAGFLIATSATHAVCEDYAIAHADSIIALSDGCSGSEFTDVGARLIAISALGAWGAVLGIENPLFPSAVLARAQAAAKDISLPLFALDATLIVAEVEPEFKKRLIVRAWGDGVLVARSRYTGLLRFWSLEFPSGIPAYLSGAWMADPLGAFRAQSGLPLWERKTRRGRCDGIDMEEVYGNSPIKDRDTLIDGLTYSFRFDDWDLVALLSDGAGSFLRQTRAESSITNAQIPLAEILPRLVGFKSTAPGFVQRRLARLRAGWAKEGVLHTDDISVAAIAIDEIGE